MNGYRIYKQNEWITDTKDYVLNIESREDAEYKEYETGFHFFSELEDARFWIFGAGNNCYIYEIKTEECHASGIQKWGCGNKVRGLKVGVTKRMKIGKLIERA